MQKGLIGVFVAGILAVAANASQTDKKYYVSAGVGFNKFHDLAKPKTSEERCFYENVKIRDKPSLSINAGRYINQNFRLDLGLEQYSVKHNSSIKVTGDEGISIAYLYRLKQKVTRFSINGFYDFPITDSTGLFFTGGLGYNFYKKDSGKFNNKLIINDEIDGVLKDRYKQYMAWNLGAGIRSYLNKAKNLGVDLGYRHVFLGKTALVYTKKGITNFSAKKIRADQLMISLFYNF